MRVLVTVASRHGATADIGERVAAVLEEVGLDVDRIAPEDVMRLDDYGAVVLGSAVYAGRWLGRANDFVDRFADELVDMPVWVFSSGPLGDPPEPLGPPPGAEAAIERIHPRSHEVFAGAIDRDDLNLAERAVVKVVKAPYGDFRDWEAVTAWATAIADTLQRPSMRPAAP
jgi:menaquinone-dependent protoporphyrinogen oxidase